MQWITEQAVLVCDHGGKVGNKPSQALVRIDGQRVLVATDPEGRSIGGCPNANVLMGMRPCITTLTVKQGYSTFIAIDGHRVCLSSVQGLTDGTPPGIVDYKVLRPGQTLLTAGS
jgi:hypothetical protein